METKYLVGGGIVAALLGYMAFKPTTVQAADLKVSTGVGIFKAGDFVIVDGNKVSLAIPTTAFANIPVQARMRIESVVSPMGPGFIQVSFADTRVNLPGILNIPKEAIVGTAP